MSIKIIQIIFILSIWINSNCIDNGMIIQFDGGKKYASLFVINEECDFKSANVNVFFPKSGNGFLCNPSEITELYSKKQILTMCRSVICETDENPVFQINLDTLQLQKELICPQ